MIFDKKSIQLLNVISFLFLNAIFFYLKLFQTFGIYDPISIKIFNKALKNNKNNEQNYFYISINTTYANIDFLTLLAFTLDLTLILN